MTEIIIYAVLGLGGLLAGGSILIPVWSASRGRWAFPLSQLQ